MSAKPPPHCAVCERRTPTLTDLYWGGRTLAVCAQCRAKLMHEVKRDARIR